LFKTRSKILLLGIVLGLVIWFIDSALDAYLFYGGGNLLFWLISPTVHEFWVKLLIFSILIIFSLIVQQKVNALKETADKLRISKNKINKSYKRLDFYKDLFFHDINNILQNIISSIDLYDIITNHEEKPQEVGDITEVIRTQVTRGGNLISNIHKISAIEMKELSMEPINLITYINDSIKILDGEVKKRRVNIQINAPDKFYYIKANDLFHDICENILYNAVIHNKSEVPEILINISKVSVERIKCFKIEFIDNGKGIEDHRKSQVFLRGFQKDRTTSGMGLGLSLVKKIVEVFNGEIWIEDKVFGDYSKGSNFVVLIPEA